MAVRSTVRETQRRIATLDAGHRRAVALMERAEARRARAQQEADERSRLEAVELEHRWLAVTLPELPSGAELGLSPLIAARPLHVAARIHSACTDLVVSRPDLDPADLVRRWTQQPGSPAGVDTSAVGPRTDTDGPPGTLPRSRAGPTLVDRLRPTSA